MDLDDFMASVATNIDIHGVHLTGVFPTSADSDIPFTYTTGLAERGLPEVLVSTLPHEVAATILNNVARKAIAGEQLSPGLRDDLVAGYPAWLVEATDVSDFGVARRRLWALGRDPLTLRGLQLCWPDTAGLFPWQDGYDVGCRQPLRGRP